MQIPLMKVSMGVFRAWKSSKLGNEMGLRNGILIHPTCQEWSNPAARQRQPRTIHKILDNPLYCISRISSPGGRSSLGGSIWGSRLPICKWQQLCHAKLEACELSTSTWQTQAPGMLTTALEQTFQESSEHTFTRYGCSLGEIPYPRPAVATLAPWEKVVRWGLRKACMEKKEYCFLSYGSNSSLTSLLIGTSIRGLSPKIRICGSDFVLRAL